MTLTSELAHALVDAARGAATADGLAVAVVVVDLGGRVVAGLRLDGAGWVHWAVAERKAIAAATFGAPTRAVAEMGRTDPVLEAALGAAPEIATVPGGVPITIGGAPVGGLGVAGAHYTQDEAVAAKAVEAVAG